MISSSLIPSGQFKTSYAKDTTIFDTPMMRAWAVAGVLALIAAPIFLDNYYLSILSQIGFMGIAALGLNILVGYTGQISLGHAGFFGFGAFASAWLNNSLGVPVLLAMPLAAVMTTLLGLLFGIPAGRLKGLYLAIATFASQFILEDFFARADWFSGGSNGAAAAPASLFGYDLSGDRGFFYVVLFWVVVMFLVAANLMRSRDGRAFVAVRDHYLSAEVMGINLTKYRILSFGLSSFYAGLGGALYGHYLGYVSAEGFTILMSIEFLGMIIIGGLGSVAGTLMGTTFMVLLPEVMTSGVDLAKMVIGGNVGWLAEGLAYIKQASIGLAIILFLIFEPDGLVHRWRLIRSYWKLYPFSY